MTIATYTLVLRDNRSTNAGKSTLDITCTCTMQESDNVPVHEDHLQIHLVDHLVLAGSKITFCALRKLTYWLKPTVVFRYSERLRIKRYTHA